MLQNDINCGIIDSNNETQTNHIEIIPQSVNKPIHVSVNFGTTNSNAMETKKKKRYRTSFTTNQLLILENAFSVHRYINRQERKKLADILMISERNVKVWFQNRRMKAKRISSDSSCDSSSNVNDSTSHVNNDQINKIVDYRLPSPYVVSSTSDKNYINFHPQYDQNQSFEYTDYAPLLTGFNYKNNHNVYPTHDYNEYNPSNYNDIVYNQNWHHDINLCHL